MRTSLFEVMRTSTDLRPQEYGQRVHHGTRLLERFMDIIRPLLWCPVIVSRVHQSDCDLHHFADAEAADLTFHPNMLAVFSEPEGLGFGMRSANNGDAPTENKDMRDNIRDDPVGQNVQASNSIGSSATLAAVVGYWKAYWKLALGILLVVLLVLFVAQNVNAIHLKFLVWETDISQALVIFLALLSGVLIGVMVKRWQRWRLSQRQLQK